MPPPPVSPPKPPTLALTQGDPAGIGPEILLRLLEERPSPQRWRPLLIAERAALDALRPIMPNAPWERLRFVRAEAIGEADVDPQILTVVDPVGLGRPIHFAEPTAADAKGALAALDLGMELCRTGRADALVTAPLNKEIIARHIDPTFRGHTDYLAQAAGLDYYGRDYLMAFLAPNLRVALLSTHLPLRHALAEVRREKIVEALRCLHQHLPPGGGRIAVAGLNPHAGELGLLGQEDEAEIRPAVEEARRLGIDAHGPESPDALFARALKGEFDWVLALYHDQGLIAVKTVSFGTATNWTLGLPYLRTSVDHGTAYGIAGQGIADIKPLRAVIETTLTLLAAPPSSPTHRRASLGPALRVQ